MTAMPGRELAVDDVVAVDRLGEEARQRALGPLAVDRVEGEGEPEQRRDDGDERVDPEDRRCPADPTVNSARKMAGDAARLRGERADPVGREVQRDRGGEAEHDQQDDEPDAQEVVPELLGGDDPPARMRDARSARRSRRRRRAAASSGAVAALMPASVRPRAPVGPSPPLDGGPVDVVERRHDRPERRQAEAVLDRGDQDRLTDAALGAGRANVRRATCRCRRPAPRPTRPTARPRERGCGPVDVGRRRQLEADLDDGRAVAELSRRAPRRSPRRPAGRRRRCRSGRRPTGPG